MNSQLFEECLFAFHELAFPGRLSCVSEQNLGRTPTDTARAVTKGSLFSTAMLRPVPASLSVAMLKTRISKHV